MRAILEKIIAWISVILGILILASCTVAGGSDLFGNPLKGILGALLGFLGGVLGACILLGWAYVYLLLRRDVKRIEATIAKLGPGAPPGAA